MKYLDYNLMGFKEFISKKKCICFGTGIQGCRIINLLESWGKTDNIIAFVDNDKRKIGGTMIHEGFKYPIVSLKDSLKKIDENTFIVISCLEVTSIKRQLEEYKELKDVACFSLVELARNQLCISDYDAVIRNNRVQTIPKKIHYCWFGEEMPDFLKENIRKWRNLCPDYEIIEWNEKNYDVTKVEYMREAFKNKLWAFVSDYVRLDVLYEYGGIYLDTDVEMVQRPDELLYQEGFMCFDATFQPNTGAGFACKAKHPIIKKLRDFYSDMDFYKNDGEINNLPCNIYTYNVLKHYGLVLNDTLQEIEGINIYPMIIQGSCIHTKQKRITNKTFFVHYGTNTWFKQEQREIKEKLNLKSNEEVCDLQNY